MSLFSFSKRKSVPPKPKEQYCIPSRRWEFVLLVELTANFCTNSTIGSDSNTGPLEDFDLSGMDAFFRRHFKKKKKAKANGVLAASDPWSARPGVALSTSKARRSSSASLPSALLAECRHSNTQLHESLPASGGQCSCEGRPLNGSRHGRRRSSTTTPILNRRFAVRHRAAGQLHAIDAHLLGSSILLASLLQIAKEDDGRTALGTVQQVVVRGAGPGRVFSGSESEVDMNSRCPVRKPEPGCQGDQEDCGGEGTWQDIDTFENLPLRRIPCSSRVRGDWPAYRKRCKLGNAQPRHRRWNRRTFRAHRALARPLTGVCGHPQLETWSGSLSYVDPRFRRHAAVHPQWAKAAMQVLFVWRCLSKPEVKVSFIVPLKYMLLVLCWGEISFVLVTQSARILHVWTMAVGKWPYCTVDEQCFLYFFSLKIQDYNCCAVFTQNLHCVGTVL